MGESHVPLECSGYLQMFIEEDEDFSLFFFVLSKGELTCYEKETKPGTRIGDVSTMLGEPIHLKGYELATPSPERLLLCEGVDPNSFQTDPKLDTINEEEVQESLQIQFLESNEREYNKWLAALQEHIAYVEGRYNPSVSDLKSPGTTPSKIPKDEPVKSSEAPPPQNTVQNLASSKTLATIAPENLPLKYFYAEKTIEMLRAQVRTAGKVPLEYIPLENLKEEISQLAMAATQDKPYDEARFDFLLMCLDQNPEHRAEKEEETRIWRENIHEYATECLDIMRGFIPPYISQITEAKLKDEGMSKDLARRLFNKKCLWLIRCTTFDIGRLHIAELQGRYNYEAQGLDIVELAAIYAVVPPKFLNDDASGSKERWRTNLETQLKTMYSELKADKLPKNKQRVIQYKGQKPLFTSEETQVTFTSTKADIDSKRTSFLALRKSKMHNSSNKSSASNSSSTVSSKAALGPGPTVNGKANWF